MAFLSPHEIIVAAGDPHSVIRVSNIQAFVKVGTDAWGRPGKVQPVLISASLQLRNPFSTASTDDSVDKSTVHYGMLSKVIQAAAEGFEEFGAAASLRRQLPLRGTLMLFWHYLLERLTGYRFNESREERLEKLASPEIRTELVKCLDIKVTLPKASLLGNGISIYGTITLDEHENVLSQSRGMRIQGLRIPTLIGVNANERLAKQIVVASVDINSWIIIEDCYAQLEQLIVKTVEESTFQTLEALAYHVSWRILNHYLPPSADYPTQRIKICLEKPTAVTVADAPAVEYTLDESNNLHPNGDRRFLTSPIPPFPLQGRLNEWIKSNCPPGTE